MVVLDTLTPAERLTLVFHDVFGVSFGEVSTIIDRYPAAARQLASRARRRVPGAAAASDAARSRKREMVAAFLAASRGGDFGALLTLLDPDAVLVADPAAVQMGADRRRSAVPTRWGLSSRAGLRKTGSLWPTAFRRPCGRPAADRRSSSRSPSATGRSPVLPWTATRTKLSELDIVFLSAGGKER